MNVLGIFIIGAFITLLVAAAIGALVSAAVEDGQRQRRKEKSLKGEL